MRVGREKNGGQNMLRALMFLGKQWEGLSKEGQCSGVSYQCSFWLHCGDVKVWQNCWRK